MGTGLDAKQLKLGTNKWSRIIHVYTSMAALLIVLFFGITGITLNHPTWSIGDSVSRSTVTGTLPFPAVDKGTVDFLSISEYMRSEHGVSGEVEAFGSNGTEGSISYRKTGYQADVTFNEATNSYDLVIEQQGFLGVVNDLHKGQNADSSWKWLIDVSGLLLVTISFSGMVMQLFLRKRRRSAFAVAAVGAVTVLILIWITLS